MPEQPMVKMEVIAVDGEIKSRGEMSDPRAIMYLGVIAHDALRIMEQRELMTPDLKQAQNLIKAQLKTWGVTVGGTDSPNGTALWKPSSG